MERDQDQVVYVIRTECSKEFGGQNPGETLSYWNAEANPSEQTGSR